MIIKETSADVSPIICLLTRGKCPLREREDKERRRRIIDKDKVAAGELWGEKLP